MPTALFLDKDLGDFLSEKKRAMLDAIDNLDRDAVLRAEGEESFAEIVRPYEVDSPQLVEDLITWDKEDVPPKKGGAKAEPRTKIQFFVPFKGGADLFRCYTVTQRVNERVSADIYSKDAELALTYELPDPIPAQFRARLDQDLTIIRYWLEQIEPLINAHNASLRSAAEERIDSRRALLQDRDWEKELGYPRRESPKPK